MAVHVAPSDDQRRLMIRVDGAFDFHVHREFRDAYRKGGDHVSDYVIDLAGTDYMDSCALGMLVLMHERLASSQGRVRVINADTGIRRILELAKLDQLIDID